MDSDRSSNRFLGFRRGEAISGHNRRIKGLPLMYRNSSVAMILLLFIVAGVSNASMLSKHRLLIGEHPKDSSNTSTLPVTLSPSLNYLVFRSELVVYLFFYF